MLGDNLELLRGAAGRLRADGLRRPAVQHGQDADAPHARHRRGRGRRPDGLRRAPLRLHAARDVLLPRRLRRLPRLPRAAPARAAPRARRHRHAVPAPRLPRGAPRQAAARRGVRPRVLPQRADLGLRLRRQAQAPLAAEARHDPRLRQGPGALLLRRRGGRARALHGARAWSRRRRPRAGRCRSASSGTRSSPPPAREKTGYPTQKPEGLVRRFVHASSRPGDLVPGPVRRLRARSARSRPPPAAATC